MFKPPDRYHLIAEDVQIAANDWTVIPLASNIKLDLRKQEVCLSVPEARLNMDSDYACLPDGTSLEATVELQDQAGVWHKLVDGRFSVSGNEPAEVSSIGFAVESVCRGQDVKFLSLTIRATQPFTCSKIRWHCYNMK